MTLNQMPEEVDFIAQNVENQFTDLESKDI